MGYNTIRRDVNNINVEFNKPEKEIEGIVTKCGGQSARCSSTYSGARVDFRIDDKLDEKVFKKMEDVLWLQTNIAIF